MKRISQYLSLNMYNVIFIFINLVIGQLINYYLNAYDDFTLIQLLMTFALMIILYSSSKIDLYLSQLNEDVNYADIYKKYITKHYSNSILIYSFIFGFISIIEFIFLDFIVFNFMGIYLIISGIIALTISGIGYLRCVYYILFLSKIEKYEIKYYNEFNPIETPIVKLIYTILDINTTALMTAGLIYVYVYSIVAPLDLINIAEFNIYHLVLLFSWLIVFICIILAIVFIILYPRKILHNIVKKLKNKSKSKIIFIMKEESKQLNNYNKIELIERTFNVLNHIDQTKASNSIGKSIYIFSVIIGLSSLVIAISKLLNAIVDIIDFLCMVK